MVMYCHFLDSSHQHQEEEVVEEVVEVRKFSMFVLSSAGVIYQTLMNIEELIDRPASKPTIWKCLFCLLALKESHNPGRSSYSTLCCSGIYLSTLIWL